jgi:DNA-binding response OmpR family regulator
MTSHDATILVIEDDRALREGLVLNFELHGYRVDAAADGEEGMRKAFDIRPDLIVLDIMLPGWSGLDILTELRDRNENVPVLILSARGTTDNKVEGLNIGADDYLSKPFELPELLARVEAMLRRRSVDRPTEPPFIFGQVVLDRENRRCSASSRCPRDDREPVKRSSTTCGVGTSKARPARSTTSSDRYGESSSRSRATRATSSLPMEWATSSSRERLALTYECG